MMLVQSLPYPESQFPELIVNGTFDNGTSGWEAVADGDTLSAVDGWGRVTCGDGAGSVVVSEGIPTVIGTTYRLKAEWRSGDPAKSWRIVVGHSPGDVHVYTSASSPQGSVDDTFVAQDTTTYVSLRNTSAQDVGDYGELDNVSVKQASP